MSPGKSVGIVSVAGELIEELRRTIYTHHEWRLCARRDLARQCLAKAIDRLGAGDEDGTAEAMKAAADIVSLDAREAALARELVNLTDEGNHAWGLLWRDLNLRSRGR